MSQASLFGPEDERAIEVVHAVKKRNRAEKRVVEAADVEWLERAWRVLVGYCTTHEEFFVDDFWRETGLEAPREARALGPLIKKAAKLGYIERTGRSRPSVRSNLSDKPVWRCRRAS